MTKCNHLEQVKKIAEGTKIIDVHFGRYETVCVLQVKSRGKTYSNCGFEKSDRTNQLERVINFLKEEIIS